MKSHNVFERLEKVESDMIVKKSVIRKEVKSTNEDETRKKIIMIFNLKNKTYHPSIVSLLLNHTFLGPF